MALSIAVRGNACANVAVFGWEIFRVFRPDSVPPTTSKPKPETLELISQWARRLHMQTPEIVLLPAPSEVDVTSITEFRNIRFHVFVLNVSKYAIQQSKLLTAPPVSAAGHTFFGSKGQLRISQTPFQNPFITMEGKQPAPEVERKAHLVSHLALLSLNAPFWTCVIPLIVGIAVTLLTLPWMPTGAYILGALATFPAITVTRAVLARWAGQRIRSISESEKIPQDKIQASLQEPTGDRKIEGIGYFWKWATLMPAIIAANKFAASSREASQPIIPSLKEVD